MARNSNNEGYAVAVGGNFPGGVKTSNSTGNVFDQQDGPSPIKHSEQIAGEEKDGGSSSRSSGMECAFGAERDAAGSKSGDRKKVKYR